MDDIPWTSQHDRQAKIPASLQNHEKTRIELVRFSHFLGKFEGISIWAIFSKKHCITLYMKKKTKFLTLEKSSAETKYKSRRMLFYENNKNNSFDYWE